MKRLKSIEVKRKKKNSLSESSKRDDNKPIAVTSTELAITPSKQPPLLCLQIFSNSIPMTSSENKITPETNTIVTSSSITTCSPSSTALYTTLTTPIMATSVFVPIIKSTQSKYTKIKPKPIEIPGKVPIPALKRKVVSEQEKTKQIKRRKKEQVKKNENADRANENLNEQSKDNNKTVIKLSERLASELSNDLFANLQVPQSGSNPESLSPTAAYLMNFPLVSTDISSKIADDGNNESQACEIQEKNANTSLLLEDNFSTFFTTNTDNMYNLGEPPPANAVLPTPATLPVTVQSTFSATSNLEKNNVNHVKEISRTDDSKKNTISQNFQASYISLPSTTASSSTFTFSLSNTTSSTSNTSHSSKNTFLPITPALPTSSFIASKSNLDFLPKPNFPAIKSSVDDEFFNYTTKSANINSCSSFTFSLTNPVSTMTTTTSTQNFYYNKNFPFPTIPTTNTSNFNAYSWDNPPPPPVAVSSQSQSQNNSITNFTFSLTSNSTSLPKYTCPPPPSVTSTYNTYNPFSTDQYESHQNFMDQKTPTKKNSNNKTAKYHTPVNWMTSPQFPPLDFTQPSIISNNPTSAPSYYPPPIPPPKSDIFFAHPPEDNFPWSPNKMSNIMDSSHLNHFIPATLPTLQGDLALSTPAACAIAAYEQPKPYEQPKAYEQPKPYEQMKAYEQTKSYEQPKVYEQSKSYVQPKVYEQSKTYEQSKAYEVPKIYENTKPFEQLKAYEQPKPYELPKTYENSKLFDQPKAYEQSRSYDNHKPYEQQTKSLDHSKSYDQAKNYNQAKTYHQTKSYEQSKSYEQPKSQNTNNFFSVNQMIEGQKNTLSKSKSSTNKPKEPTTKSRSSTINYKPPIPPPVIPPTTSWNLMPSVQDTMLTYNDYLSAQPPQPPPPSLSQKQVSSISCNNYSAESLIGNQTPNDHRKRHDTSNYGMSSTDSYFPPVDLNLETNNYNPSFLYPNNYSTTNATNTDNSYYSDNYAIKSANNYNKYPPSRSSKTYSKTKNIESSSYFPSSQAMPAAPTTSLHFSSQILHSTHTDESYHHQQHHLFHSALPPSSSSYLSSSNQMSSNNFIGTSSTSSVGGASGGNALSNFNVRSICPEINEKNRWI